MSTSAIATETNRLCETELRRPRVDDAPFLAELWRHPRIAAASQPSVPPPVPSGAFARRIDAGEPAFFNGVAAAEEWIVASTADPLGAPLGVGGMYGVDGRNGVAEIGVVLAPPAARSGHGIDTMVMLARRAFSVHGLHGVYAQVKGSNAAALGTVQRLGLRQYGAFPEHRLVDGRREDLLVFGLLAREWTPRLEDWRTWDGRAAPPTP